MSMYFKIGMRVARPAGDVVCEYFSCELEEKATWSLSFNVMGSERSERASKQARGWSVRFVCHFNLVLCIVKATQNLTLT